MVPYTFLAASSASVLLTSVNSIFLKACLDKRGIFHSCLPIFPVCFDKKSLPIESVIFERQKTCMRNEKPKKPN